MKEPTVLESLQTTIARSIREQEAGTGRNRRGDVVNEGMHTCVDCKETKDSFEMHWTTGTKVCIKCYWRER